MSYLRIFQPLWQHKQKNMVIRQWKKNHFILWYKDHKQIFHSSIYMKKLFFWNSLTFKPKYMAVKFLDSLPHIILLRFYCVPTSSMNLPGVYYMFLLARVIFHKEFGATNAKSALTMPFFKSHRYHLFLIFVLNIVIIYYFNCVTRTMNMVLIFVYIHDFYFILFCHHLWWWLLIFRLKTH